MEAVPAWANPQRAAAASSEQQQQQSSLSPSTQGRVSVEEHEQALFSKYSTLDEPVSETILRDVRAVGAKLRVVLMPLDHSATLVRYAVVPTRESSGNAAAEPELSENDQMVLRQLKDWDLWGPLVLCLSLAVLLSFKAPTNQAALVFAAVFCAVWVGGTVVTVNAQLLGGTISFFQSLCVLGYSTFPLVLSAAVIGFLRIFVRRTWLWLDLLVCGVGCVWAMRTSAVFISLYMKTERRALALYPVVFFYTFLAWLIVLF